MRNFQLTIILFLVLIMGALAGIRIQHKLDSLGPKSKKKKEIRFQNGRIIKDYSDLTYIENLMNSKNINFRFMDTRDNNDMGLISPFRLFQSHVENRGIVPVYTASSDPSHECFQEFQTVSNANIQNIESLKEKNIGIYVGDSSVERLAAVELKALSEKNISARKLYIYSNLKSGFRNLAEGKIDALISEVSVFSNNLIINRLGPISESHSAFPRLNILRTSNFKIPCKLIFMSNNLSPEIKFEIEEKLTKILSNPSMKASLQNAINTASIRKISPENWNKIMTIFKDAENFDFKSFAPEVNYVR